MRIRKFRFRQASEGEDEDLNITALIDIFTMLLFFLLTAAAFTRTTILELNLPAEDENLTTSPLPPDTKENFSLTVAVTQSGFTLKDKEGKNIFIARKNSEYDYEALSRELKKIKDLSPGQKNIVLLLEPEIMYEVIIKTMDHTREQIIKKDNQVQRYSLFPEISLADSLIIP